MRKIFKLDRRQLCMIFAVGFASVPVFAQAPSSYPTRPITLIVGWPAGGPADNVARIVANNMSLALGQTVVIDNRAGAGGNIGSELAAKSKPDGYTILLATAASHGWNSELYSKLNYKPIDDFSPIGLISNSPSTLLVPVDSPYKTLRNLMEAAKAQPGKLNFASAGIGSSQHMGGAMFKNLGGLDVAHIPFKGTAPAITDLMAGRVDFIITTGATAFVRSGKLRAIAVASPRRLPMLPDIPTFDEAGLKGFYTDSWYGLVAPAGTPRPVLEALNAALVKTLQTPDVQKQIMEQGAVAATPMTVEAYWAFVRRQMSEAAVMVRAAGAKFE